MTKLHDPIISEVMTDIAVTYYPSIQWYEPIEPEEIIIELTEVVDEERF